MRIDLIHPKELSADDCAKWRAHQTADSRVASPFLTPDWAKTVAQVRDDARVCVIDGGQGYFGVQRLSRYAAMGLGAPIADYQGVVGTVGLAVDPAQLCRALKVGRIDVTHVPEGQSLLPRPAGTEGSWIVELEGGSEAYLAKQKQARREFVRQTEKKLRKLERDVGPVEFIAHSTDALHFETMLCWKLRQLAQTGQPPIWSKPWVRSVLERTRTSNDPAFSGALFTISIGGRLIAANYFLRSGGVLHDWIMAHDNEFDAYSPGVLLARRTIEWAADNGYSELDFGPGNYQYKRQLSTTQRMLGWGAVTRLSWSGAVRTMEFALRAGIEKIPQKRIADLPGKAMRRLDLMRGLAHAA